MNVICRLIAGAEFAAVRSEACRIEDKADKALDECVKVAADTSVVLKRAADAVEKLHGTLAVIAERQKWLAQEQSKIADYLLSLHQWLQESFRPGSRGCADYRLECPVRIATDSSDTQSPIIKCER